MGTVVKVLEARLDRIEAKRSALLERLAGLDPRLLSTPPRPDAWSILDIVEHLVRAEDAVLGDLSDPEAVAWRTPGRPSLLQRILHVVVLSVLRSGVPVRVPSREMLPGGGLSLETLGHRWEGNHRRLRRVVEHLEPSAAGRAVFRHPVSGPLTLRQALRLLEIHLDRHLGQIRAIEESRPPWETAAPPGPADPLAALPDRLETERTLLRLWTPEDAPALQAALEESVGHLDPWVPWATEEPPEPGRGLELVRRWEAERQAGENRIWAVVERGSGRLLGGIGLYRRLGAGALEAGYWLRASASGRGYATEVARAVTRAGLEAPGVLRLEMHVDPANRASARIPRKLGYAGGPEVFVLSRDDARPTLR